MGIDQPLKGLRPSFKYSQLLKLNKDHPKLLVPIASVRNKHNFFLKEDNVTESHRLFL